MKASYKRVYLRKDDDNDTIETISPEEQKAQLRREQILVEINANKVSIDRECFKHSFIERKKLKEAKSSYKKLNGTSEFEKDSAKLVNQILKSSSFDCGELKIIYLN